MNQQTIEKLKEVFVPVAEKIGQGAEFGWEVVMRQQYVSGVGYLLTSLVGFILIIFGIWCAKNYKRLTDEDEFPFGIIGATFGFIVGGILFIVSFYEGLARFINPAFYAIQFFMGLVN